jgi:uracil-DNA glycosylase family 4
MPGSCWSASSRVMPKTSPAILLSARRESCSIAAWVTNVVKHFKWVPRGTRRLHSKPGSLEITACLPWLEAEIRAVGPQVVVALGATAAQALFGKAFRVTRDRGRYIPSGVAPRALATVHPSALLRAPDENTRRREIARFIEDLRKIAAISP